MEGKGIIEALEERVKLLEERLAVAEKRIELDEKELIAIRKGVKMERESLNFIVSRYAWTLDKKTAAGILGVTRATVYAMIRDGRLSELPDGRISASSVADYMDGNGGQSVPLKRGKKRGQSA